MYILYFVLKGMFEVGAAGRERSFTTPQSSNHDTLLSDQIGPNQGKIEP